MTEVDLLTTISEQLTAIENLLTAIHGCCIVAVHFLAAAASGIGFQVVLYAARNKQLWG